MQYITLYNSVLLYSKNALAVIKKETSTKMYTGL